MYSINFDLKKQCRDYETKIEIIPETIFSLGDTLRVQEMVHLSKENCSKWSKKIKK
jgi:hypothetical protein